MKPSIEQLKIRAYDLGQEMIAMQKEYETKAREMEQLIKDIQTHE